MSIFVWIFYVRFCLFRVVLSFVFVFGISVDNVSLLLNTPWLVQ